MIPADYIIIDGDTALVVFDPMQTCDPGIEPWPDLNRPCATCGGDGTIDVSTRGPDGYDRCPACDGTGRHTFDIEYEDVDELGRAWKVRVHVIDVLEILGTPSDPWVTCEDDEDPITLPPAAKPGMWLARLAVNP